MLLKCEVILWWELGFVCFKPHYLTHLQLAGTSVVFHRYLGKLICITAVYLMLFLSIAINLLKIITIDNCSHEERVQGSDVIVSLWSEGIRFINFKFYVPIIKIPNPQLKKCWWFWAKLWQFKENGSHKTIMKISFSIVPSSCKCVK